MTVRPLIFWGIDEPAAGLVKQLADILINKAVLFQVFESQEEDPIQEFRNMVITFRETIQSQGNTAEPGIVLFSSTFFYEFGGLFFNFIS